jgi:hypothetical protein
MLSLPSSYDEASLSVTELLPSLLLAKFIYSRRIIILKFYKGCVTPLNIIVKILTQFLIMERGQKRNEYDNETRACLSLSPKNQRDTLTHSHPHPHNRGRIRRREQGQMKVNVKSADYYIEYWHNY